MNINLAAANTWVKTADGFTVPTAVSSTPVLLDETENYRGGAVSSLEPITADRVKVAGQIAYIVLSINGNMWGYTTNATTDTNQNLSALQAKVASHLGTGVSAQPNSFTANDAANMTNEIKNLVDSTVEIPYAEVAAKTITLNHLREKVPAAQQAEIDKQVTANNKRLAALQAAMTGGAIKRGRHRRSRRRGLNKRARRHSKTRHARR
jgi:hypothetical protein